MIRVVILGISLFASGSALAQSAPTYASPDRELWEALVRALSDVPMSLSAHQQVQQMLAGVQQQAQLREARAKAAAEAKAKATDEKLKQPQPEPH